MRRAIVVVVLLGFLLPVMALADEVLVIGTTDRVTELSFANAYDFWTWHVFRNTTEALLTIEPKTCKLAPAIAESWEISDDGLVYTFHIRPGITFWDGAPCDAHAVKWALDRTLRLNGPKGGVGLIKPVIKQIDVVDDLTVQITLNYPDATFLPENEFARGRYAGTGPYKLVEYVPDERIVYEAYEGYWGEPPKTKRIVEVMYSDAAALRAAIEAETFTRRAQAFVIFCSM